MNLLVTGGAGFVGSNFIRYILKKYPGYKVICLDVQPNRLKDSRFGSVAGDVGNRELVEKIIARQPDAIVNFAAGSLETDVLGTRNLLEAAKKNQATFLQVSTSQVCGSGLSSASKMGADLIVQAYRKDLPVLITRSVDNYGPFQKRKELIPSLIDGLLKDEETAVGLRKRDWVYVLDHCSAIDCVLHHGKNGEIYDVSANTEKTDWEMAKLIAKLLEKESLVIKKESDCGERCFAEATKIRQLGWRPKYMLEEAMSDTIDWYVNNLRYGIM